jgi:hypothetical protein
MLHLNVPAPKDGFWTIFWRKARWLLLGILAPEVPMMFACGQWSSAKRSVKQMHDLGFSESQWTLSHAFFADMGGIVLKLRDEEPFPITAKQLAWLVQHKHTELPRISEREIKDKSKADICTKMLAVVQTTWFMIQMIGRGAEHLPIVPIELASAALALTSLTTLRFWHAKPLDAQQPYMITISTSVAGLREVPGVPDAKIPEVTEVELSSISTSTPRQAVVLPLNEVEPNAYISRKWCRFILRWIVQMDLQRFRLDRIPNDRDPQILGFKQHATLGVATAAFASLHFIDWHFAFSTYVELVLWRVSCCVMWVLLAGYGSAEVYICWREGYQKLGMDTAGAYKMRWPACLWFLIPAWLYFLARVAVTVQVFINLRALPPDAFRQVQWTTVIPHI